MDKFLEAVESEKKLLKCKEYLATLSKNENGEWISTNKETLRNILKSVDNIGIDKTISEMKVSPIWINEIIENRTELEQGFKLVKITKNKGKSNGN